MSGRRVLLVAAAVLVFVPAVVATGNAAVVTVGPFTPNGWNYTNFGTNASLAFKLIGGAPLGTGAAALSHECSTPVGQNGGALHTSNFDGTRLADIIRFRYSTLQAGDSTPQFQPPYVVLTIDLDNDGVLDDRIAFEPSWQTGDRPMATSLNGNPISAPNRVNVEQNGLFSTGAAVATNTWWEWDLLIGSWYSYGCQALYPDVGCGQQPLVTIAGIVEVYPNARIIAYTTTGGLRLQYGFGGTSCNYVGYVDKLVLDTATTATTVNFELQTFAGAVPVLSRNTLIAFAGGLMILGILLLRRSQKV